MLGLIQCKIQTGRSGSATVTIEEVSDISKCSVYCSANGSAYLSSTTTLVITTLTTYGQSTVDWQIIEHGGAV